MQYNTSGLPKWALSRRGWIVAYIVIVSALLTGIVGVMYFAIGFWESMGLAIFPAIFAIAYVQPFEEHRMKKFRQRVQDFARENQLKSCSRGLDNSDIPPILSTHGDIRAASFKNAYQFVSHDIPMLGYEIEIEVLNLEMRHPRKLQFWVVKLEIQAEFPHLYLDAHNNDIGEGYRRTQRLQLEGNFNEYFNLYLPDGDQVDVLSVVTPDIMQVLMDSGRPYDIEIIGHNVFICSRQPIYQQEVLPHVLSFAEKLFEQLSHRAVSWKHPLQGAPPVLPRIGRRLQLRDIPVVILIFFASVGLLILPISLLFLLVKMLVDVVSRL